MDVVWESLCCGSRRIHWFLGWLDHRSGRGAGGKGQPQNQDYHYKHLQGFDHIHVSSVNNLRESQGKNSVISTARPINLPKTVKISATSSAYIYQRADPPFRGQIKAILGYIANNYNQSFCWLHQNCTSGNIIKVLVLCSRLFFSIILSKKPSKID